jgi:hypothetical protein
MIENYLSKVVLLLFFLILPSFPLKAQDSESLKAKLRPLVEKYIGAKWANTIFGKKESSNKEIGLPPIPQVNLDARSTEIYDKKDNPYAIKISKTDARRYNIAYVRELIEVVRSRKPKRKDLERWVNVLDQGASREGVYNSLVLGENYAQMESFRNNSIEEVANFAQFYFEKFLARNTDKQTLMSSNFFTIKRVIVEKTLEVLDSFKEQDNLFKWYSVFSRDLALKFPNLYKSKIRKNSSTHNHYRWAKKVPSQHLKSEVILKLHIALNSLQNPNN